MSWVTNMMLSVSFEDEPLVVELSDWLRSHGGPHGSTLRGCGYLRDLTSDEARWGGRKMPECTVWAGALNHADIPALLAKVAEFAWLEPDTVQLFLMDQDDICFQVWMVRGGVWRQYAPMDPFEGSGGDAVIAAG
ncbi:squamosa promoter-binding protein 15 [Nocardia sp. NPDC058658]|uniref:squamosa promoter-binding protein 15 n=1 Tax=Nocardia sp. NPDC058658 TaxID=3346580 RepID=UPI003656D0B3